MARQWEPGARLRLINRIVTAMTRRGWGPSEILTVPGRVSGQPRSVPLTPLELSGARYLVAPYGTRDWVKNLRATPTATLSRAGKKQEIRASEVVDPAEVAVVLKAYVTKLTIVRPYFDAQPEDSLDAFAAEASAHPVFRID